MTLFLKLNMFFLALLFSNQLLAQDNSQQAIHIEADRAEMREQENISIYTGNVSISRGNIHISGDQVTIKSNATGALSFITVTGKPARFNQLNEQGEQVDAESQELIYQADSGLLELKVDALLSKGPNKFSSQHIIYDSKANIVKAGKDDIENNTQPARVQITIQAEQNKQNKE